MSNSTTIDESSLEEQYTTDSRTLLLLAGLVVLVLVVKWRCRRHQLRFIHEITLALAIGLLAGGVINLSGRSWYDTTGLACNSTARILLARTLSYETYTDKLESPTLFDPELFFYITLPPLVFDAGYQLHQRQFFRNFSAIFLFSFVGSIIATCLTGSLLYAYSNNVDLSLGISSNDALLFGALTSATDYGLPLSIFVAEQVDDDLASLVHGESLFNNAFAIVLYSTIAQYKAHTTLAFNSANLLNSIWVFLLIFFGSMACGCLVGMTTAFVVKFTSLKENPAAETALFFLFSFISFLASEGFGLTGVVAILFCGITQAHYTFPNLSEDSRLRTRQLSGTLRLIAECIVYLYIGLTVFTYRCHHIDPALTFWSLMIVLASRLAVVFPLSFILNLFARRRSIRLDRPWQIILFWASTRGTISFALALRNTATAIHQVLLSTTVGVILLTTVLFGGSLKYMLNRLHLSGTSSDDIRRRRAGHLATCWLEFDRRLLRPVFSHTADNYGTRDWPSLVRTVCACCHGEADAEPSVPLVTGAASNPRGSVEMEPLSPPVPTTDEEETLSPSPRHTLDDRERGDLSEGSWPPVTV
eukprot:m.120974 g.120974  ORF g.120974 m.120974 type:complete len:588 (-) comp14565_c0_seq3:473-2236(-)